MHNGQKCLLFVNNDIVQVVVSNDKDKDETTVSLKIIDKKIILPEIISILCFLRTEHDIIIGSIEIA